MSSVSTEITLPTQDMLDAVLGDREASALVLLVSCKDGSMEYYYDGCSVAEAVGLTATLQHIMIEDGIGKTRGFTFN